MRIPEEFRTFASFFDLSLHDGNPSEQALIAFALRHTSQEHRRIVKAYLDELLSSSASGKELQKIWFESGAGMFVSDPDEFRGFLKMIQGELLGEQ